MLLSIFPQDSKSFERWYQEVSNVARFIDYDHYEWKQATVDAIILQTFNAKLRERDLLMEACHKYIQEQIDEKWKTCCHVFPTFLPKTGKFKGRPIQIQVKPDATPIIKSPSRILLQYVERTKKKIQKMLQEEII